MVKVAYKYGDTIYTPYIYIVVDTADRRSEPLRVLPWLFLLALRKSAPQPAVDSIQYGFNPRVSTDW